MRTLIVTLPKNRDYAGKLRLEDEDGAVMAGPFYVCGRADDAVAQSHDNPNRDPLLPFGNTPLGRYRVLGVVASGAGSHLPAEGFGPHGVIALEPTGGDAALADANGRFHFLIQGGEAVRGRRLRPTNGSLRLANSDLKKLVRALRDGNGVVCECLPMSESEIGVPIARDVPCDEGDPPLGVPSVMSLLRPVPSGAVRGLENSLTRFAGEPPSRFAPPAFTLAYHDDSGSGGGGGGAGDGYNGDDEQPRTFGDVLSDTVSSAGSAVKTALEQLPDTLLSKMNDHIVNTFNEHLQNEGQQPLTGSQAKALNDDINKSLGQICDGIGIHISDKLDSAVNEIPADDALAKLSGKHAARPAKTEFVSTLGVGAFSFNTKGQMGVKYNVLDFKQYGSFKTAIAPLTTNLNQLTIKASAGSADYSGQFSTSLTISNKTGKLQFNDVNVSFGVKF
jgi:hypothetical protein